MRLPTTPRSAGKRTRGSRELARRDALGARLRPVVLSFAMLPALAADLTPAQPSEASCLQCSSEAGIADFPVTRDALRWPFAPDSIWNTPIGSAAVYLPANLPGVPGNDSAAPMPQLDEELIVLAPAAPVTAIYQSHAGWSGGNRCASDAGPPLQLLSAPLPPDFVVSNSKANNAAALLAADGRTILQTQPLTRCEAGGPATSMVNFPAVDLFGDGMGGAHGGSGLSSIGGSIRSGELRPGSIGPRHALKVNVYARQVLFPCTVKADCFRWPANRADSYAVGAYGLRRNDAMNDPTKGSAMRMGALLAIPPSTTIDSLQLETEPGRQLAWTLQNYGAYIVDDTFSPGFALNVEAGPGGTLRAQFRSDWGYEIEQRVRDNSPWVRDMQRLVQALYVIDNNAPDRIGGGGTPRQPIAPPFQRP
jgi:hypothetical protein